MMEVGIYTSILNILPSVSRFWKSLLCLKGRVDFLTEIMCLLIKHLASKNVEHYKTGQKGTKNKQYAILYKVPALIHFVALILRCVSTYVSNSLVLSLSTVVKNAWQITATKSSTDACMIHPRECANATFKPEERSVLIHSNSCKHASLIYDNLTIYKYTNNLLYRSCLSEKSCLSQKSAQTFLHCFFRAQICFGYQFSIFPQNFFSFN